MKSVLINLRAAYCIFVLMLMPETSFAQEKNPTVYPYGGVPDSNSTGQEKKEVYLSLWETLLNCTYFSVMVFFTFRLKRDILTFFDAKEKK